MPSDVYREVNVPLQPAGRERQLENAEMAYPPRSRLHPDLECVRVGDTTILTVGGAIHLALTPDESGLLHRVDGTLDDDELATLFPPDESGSSLLADLAEAGMLAGTSPPAEPRIAWSSAGIEFAGFDRLIATLHRGGRYLVRPGAFAAAAIIGGIGLAAWIAAPEPGRDMSATAVLLIAFVFGVATAIAHEAAHALVIHDGGRRVGRAGFGFYWGSISYFVDATDAFFLPRRVRVRQAMAGPAVDVAIAGILGIVAFAASGSTAGMLAGYLAALLWVDIAVNLSPFLQLDGYWIASDLLNRPRLHQESRAALARPRAWRADRRLALFGVASLAFGLALVAAVVSLWAGAIWPLVTDAWAEGTLGKAVAVLTCAPLAVAAFTAALLAARVPATNRKG